MDKLAMSSKRISLIKQRMIRWATKHGWDGEGMAWLHESLNNANWSGGVSEFQQMFVADDLRQQLWHAVYATIGK